MFVDIVSLVIEHTRILDFIDYIHLRQVNAEMCRYMSGVKFREFSLTETDFKLYKAFHSVDYEYTKLWFLTHPGNTSLALRYIELYGLVLPDIPAIERMFVINFRNCWDNLILLIKNGLLNHISSTKLCYEIIRNSTVGCKIIEYMIIHKYVNVNERSGDYNLLAFTLIYQRYDVFELLIKHGADLTLDGLGLMIADCAQYPEYVKCILRLRHDELDVRVLEDIVNDIDTRLKNEPFLQGAVDAVHETRALLMRVIKQKTRIIGGRL